MACLELHTFSSLNENFLEQYRNTMASADIAYVYYNPETVRHKKLAFFEPQAVYDAFGTPRLEVFTDSKALFEKIKNMDLYEKNLLIMTSGNLGGVNLLGFPDLIGFDEKRT